MKRTVATRKVHLRMNRHIFRALLWFGPLHHCCGPIMFSCATSEKLHLTSTVYDSASRMRGADRADFRKNLRARESLESAAALGVNGRTAQTRELSFAEHHRPFAADHGAIGVDRRSVSSMYDRARFSFPLFMLNSLDLLPGFGDQTFVAPHFNRSS